MSHDGEWSRETIPIVVGGIGVIIYAVIMSALLPTILAEHAPTTVMATIALIEGLIHSPDATVTRAITQAAPFFLLALPIALEVYDNLARLSFARELVEGARRRLQSSR